MDKKYFHECIQQEILSPYYHSKGHLNLMDKIWCKFISPEGNAMYLVRKKEYLESGNRFQHVRARLIHARLVKKYGIHVTEGTTIKKGLRIAHPIGIVITKCSIGENFTIYQNCTIGQKAWKSGLFPSIGNNVTMYSGSSIIGNVRIADNVTLGANSTLLHDADTRGGGICWLPGKKHLTHVKE